MQQVLMVDDDHELCEMVAEYLEPEGFAITPAHDGSAGLEQALGGNFTLVLLDVMLPKVSGFEVLRRLRAASGTAAAVPVIMLTARGDAVDRVVGLEVGADDYLPKPFDERELLARMRAILRRAGTTSPAELRRELVRVGDLVVDIGARTARRANDNVVLTAVEFDVLVMLLHSAGTVVNRSKMTKDVLDRKLSGMDRSIDTHISRLRRKLGPHPNGGERIRNVRSLGYVYTLPEQEPIAGS